MAIKYWRRWFVLGLGIGVLLIVGCRVFVDLWVQRDVLPRLEAYTDKSIVDIGESFVVSLEFHIGRLDYVMLHENIADSISIGLSREGPRQLPIVDTPIRVSLPYRLDLPCRVVRRPDGELEIDIGELNEYVPLDGFIQQEDGTYDVSMNPIVHTCFKWTYRDTIINYSGVKIRVVASNL